MKKLLITAVMVSAAILTSSAQVFIGGSLGVDFKSSKENVGDVTERPSTFAFEITPKAGYYLSDKMAVGLELGFMKVITNDGEETKKFSTAFGINAFGRYHLVEVNKFALVLEASLGFQTANEKMETGSTTIGNSSTNGIGIFVLPVLSYSLSDCLSLEANCDFLRFGFTRLTKKIDGTEYISDTKINANYVGFGINSGNNTVYKESFSTPFSVGFVWKF